MKKIVLIILGIVVLLGVGWVTNPYWTRSSGIVTVTDVQSKLMSRHGATQDIYLVFTTDGTYRNTDTLYYLKYNSSDIQGKLAQKGQFKITYYGFRIPIFSMYRNIIKAEKVE